ncbi:gamma carbonic anhydrase family protein [Azospirillum halopraeferens]|uniref:gamma carbonic anhydrase family protein n=1 Tax=Azospirillum halopraeferens TaxID=34010 RepID=UPI00040C6C9E|nr:gamma carbonic anhydrase family protein [Azospirillum halopraeferens]
MSGVILPFRGVRPRIDPAAFVAPTAAVAGDVTIGPDSSVWFGCTLRGDVNDIIIGARSNLQDGTVVHVSSTGQGTYVGDEVTVGHMALLHACTLESGCFIGMKACIMDGAVVESGAMVAAGALVTPGKRVKAGELWAGAPARFVRMVSAAERAEFARLSALYVDLAREYGGC